MDLEHELAVARALTETENELLNNPAVSEAVKRGIRERRTCGISPTVAAMFGALCDSERKETANA